MNYLEHLISKGDLKKLYDLSEVDDCDLLYTRESMDFAIKHGQYRIMIWLYTHCNVIGTEKSTEYAIINRDTRCIYFLKSIGQWCRSTAMDAIRKYKRHEMESYV